MIPLLIAFYGLLRRLWRLFREPEFRALAVFSGLILLLGSAFYHQVEGWSWLDSFYFSVITLATVGFGDFAPKTDLGKIFTIIYLLVGVGTLASLITFISTHRRESKTKNQDHGKSNS